MSQPKRVKFAHPQATEVPRREAPKTSEYAYFRKLKKDIGDTKSRALRKEAIQSKITKANGQNNETSTYSNKFKCSNTIVRSPSNSEKEGPNKQFTFICPVGLASNNIGIQKIEGTSSGINQRSSLLCSNAVGSDHNLFPSPFAGVAKNLGNEFSEKGVFSEKRQRLCQLAADLFPEAGKWNSKGFDLVSALFSRLLPRGNETEYSIFKERRVDIDDRSLAFPQLNTLEKTYSQNASQVQDIKSCWDDVSPRYQSGRPRERILSNPRISDTEHWGNEGKVIDPEYPLPALLELDIPEKTSPRNASKIQDGLCWDEFFPDHQSSRPRERFLPKWDMSIPGLPCIKYNAETDFQDEEASYNCGLDDKSIQYKFHETDSSSCVLFRKCGQSDLDHVKQPKGFHAPYEPLGGDADPLLLIQDVRGERKNSYFTSGNLLDFACQQIMDDRLESTSSLCSDHPLEFLSRPYVQSTCTNTHDMEWQIEPVRREVDLLLSWDFKDNEQKNSDSTLGNSLDLSFQQIVDDNLARIITCSSSLSSNHSVDFLSRQYTHLTCTSTHDMGWQNEVVREADTLLLSWDVKDKEDKNSYSTSGSSLDFACEQIMHDKLERITTCPSSLCSNHSLDFFSRPYIHSTCTNMHDKGENHQDNFEVAETDLFPLCFSSSQKYLSIREDWALSKHFDNNNINLLQQDPPSCTNRVPGRKGDSESLLFSRGLDVGLGWRSLPESDFLANYSSNYRTFQFPFNEDLCSYAVDEQDDETSIYCSQRERTLASSVCAVGILDCSSASFNVLSKNVGHPLLLDYPGRVISDEVTYVDNDSHWRDS